MKVRAGVGETIIRERVVKEDEHVAKVGTGKHRWRGNFHLSFLTLPPTPLSSPVSPLLAS